MHKPFIDMAITDINRPVSPPSPWSLPAKGTIVLPTGFLTAAGLPQVEPAVNQALAALFCHQMKTSIDVVTDWLLAWTSDRRNRRALPLRPSCATLRIKPNNVPGMRNWLRS